MKKHLIFVVLAVCLGILLTLGALQASASQSQLFQIPSQPIQTNAISRSSSCENIDPRMPAANPDCRARATIKEHQRASVTAESGLPGNPTDFAENQSGQPDMSALDRNDQNQPEGKNLQAPESYSLDVYVENASGMPAPNAYVEVYTANGNYYGYGFTDGTGHAYLDLPDGSYLISAESDYSDNFFLYKLDVVAPGSTILSAVGTPEVTLTAKDRNGLPLSSAYIYVGASNQYRAYGNVGQVGDDGVITFHVTPGEYDVKVSDWVAYYLLYTTNQDFTNPTVSVNFDMSVLTSAEIIAIHPQDDMGDVSISPLQGNLNGSYFSDIPNGTAFVVSTYMNYRAYQYIVRQEAGGPYWRYGFHQGGSAINLGPWQGYYFTIGGSLEVTGRTQDASAGTYITLTTETIDSYGSVLSGIYTYTEEYGDWWYIYPDYELTDPEGSVTHTDWYWYYLPASSPAGTYSMHFEWDTGVPYQGLITADSQFEVLPTEGLLIYVENAQGQPAVDAYVRLRSISGYGGYYTYTGADGYAVLNLPPDIYNITAYSYDEHFFLYKERVVAPGNVTLSAVGTPEVSLTAKRTDGLPLDQAEVNLGVSVGKWWAYGYLGNVDANGEMTFHVTADTYDIGVNDPYNRYGLYKVEQEFTSPSEMVDFDMSTQPYSEMIASHPNDAYTTMVLCPNANINCFYLPEAEEGAQVVVSPNVDYWPNQYIVRESPGGIFWEYEFSISGNNYIVIPPGEVVTFTVGGEISAAGQTEDAYIGDYVRLADVIDSFGSYMTYIFTYTADYSEYGAVDPYIEITDPNGSMTIYDWFWYHISEYAPTGMYDMHFEWDTGVPYQGLITADSQFEVLPQQTSGVISPDGGTLYSPWDDTLYEFSAGTFSEDVIITHTVRYVDIPPFAPLKGIGHFYDVEAVYISTGLPAQPTLPYTITIGYSDWQRWGVMEYTLGLNEWDGAQWTPEPTSLVDLDTNRLIATPDHFSTWGILGEAGLSSLPMIHK